MSSDDYRDAALQKMALFQSSAADSDDEDDRIKSSRRVKGSSSSPKSLAAARAAAAYGGSGGGKDGQDIVDEDFDVTTIITADLIREASGGEHDITMAVAADLHNRNITTMRQGALQQCANLRSLDLSFNAIDAVAGLEPLSMLKELKLYNNDTVHLHGLRAATSLQALQLQNNRIASLEGVEALRNLRSLRVDGNFLGPSAKLVGRLTALTQLDISNNGLERLEGFGTLVNLEECNVSGNRLRSLDALASCKKITELDASDNLLQDAALAHLRPLVKLDVLSLEGNALTSLEKLPTLEDLTELSLARNNLTSLSSSSSGSGAGAGSGGGVGGGCGASLADKAPFLEILDIAENAFDDVAAAVSALAELQYLTELRMAFNPCAGGGSSGGARTNKRKGGREASAAAAAAGGDGGREGASDRVGVREPTLPQPPGVRPVPPSGAGPAGGRRRKVGVGVNQGGVVGGGRIRARGEASWEARAKGGGGGGSVKVSSSAAAASAAAGWDAGAPAWAGLPPQEATAATLRYRREVVRVIPSVLYVDDIAVGDAERGPEMSPSEAAAAQEMAAFKAKHGIPNMPPALDGRPSTPAGFGFYGVPAETKSNAAAPLGRPSSRGGPGDRPRTPGGAASVGGAPLMKVRPQSARRGGHSKILPAAQYEDVAADFVGQMEKYKEQMTGLLSRLRNGLQKTPQEAVAALKADGTFEATLDNPSAMPSRMLPAAPVMASVPASVGAGAERWQMETDAALRSKQRQQDNNKNNKATSAAANDDDSGHFGGAGAGAGAEGGGGGKGHQTTSPGSQAKPFSNSTQGGGGGGGGGLNTSVSGAMAAAAAGRAGSMPRLMAEAGLAARAALDQYARAFPAQPETPSPVEATKGKGHLEADDSSGGGGGGGGSSAGNSGRRGRVRVPGGRPPPRGGGGVSDRVAAAMAAAEAAAMDSDDEDGGFGGCGGGGGGGGFFDGYVRDGYEDDEDDEEERCDRHDPERDTSLFDEDDMRSLVLTGGGGGGVGGGTQGVHYGQTVRGVGGAGGTQGTYYGPTVIRGGVSDTRAAALSGFSSADRRPLQQRLNPSQSHPLVTRRQPGAAANVGVVVPFARGPSPVSSSLLVKNGGACGGRVTPIPTPTPNSTMMASDAAAAASVGAGGGYYTQRFRPPSAGRARAAGTKAGGGVPGAGTGAGTARSVPRANTFKSGRASPLAAAGLTDILAAADAAAAGHA